jgi:hypothetical protein
VGSAVVAISTEQTSKGFGMSSVSDFRKIATERMREVADALDQMGIKPLYVSVRHNAVDIDEQSFALMFAGEELTGERDFPGSSYIRVYATKHGINWGGRVYSPEPPPKPEKKRKITVLVGATA